MRYVKTIHLRNEADVPVVLHAGCRTRRHLGTLAGLGDPVSSRERGFGALRVLDDMVLEPASQASLGAQDGFELVVYVLTGECRIEDDRGVGSDLGRDGAACAWLGRGARYDLRNLSGTAPLRVVVAALVAHSANPRPHIAARVVDEAPGLTWFGSHDPDDQREGAILLGMSARAGVATLDPGGVHVFPKAKDRGMVAIVEEGYVGFGPAFVDEGGDARARLESPVRMHAVKRSRVIVLDVPMGFAQQLD